MLRLAKRGQTYLSQRPNHNVSLLRHLATQVPPGPQASGASEQASQSSSAATGNSAPAHQEPAIHETGTHQGKTSAAFALEGFDIKAAPSTRSARPQDGVRAPVSPFPVRANHFTFNGTVEQEVDWWKSKNADWIKRAEEARQEHLKRIQQSRDAYKKGEGLDMNMENAGLGRRTIPFHAPPRSDIDVLLSVARSDALNALERKQKLAGSGNVDSSQEPTPNGGQPQSETNGPSIPSKPNYSRDGGSDRRGKRTWNKRAMWQSAFFFSCTVLFSSFCQWQLQRREWKQDLMEFRNSQLSRAPTGMARALQAIAEAFERSPKVRYLIENARGSAGKPPLIRALLGEGSNVEQSAESAGDGQSWKREFADALGKGIMDPALDREAMEEFLFSLTYLPVFAQGRFDYSRECLVGASTGPIDPDNVKRREFQTGFFVVTPFILDNPITVKLPSNVYKQGSTEGSRPESITIRKVLVNRGWFSKELTATFSEHRVFENQYLADEEPTSAATVTRDADTIPTPSASSSWTSWLWPFSSGSNAVSTTANIAAPNATRSEPTVNLTQDENGDYVWKGPSATASANSMVANQAKEQARRQELLALKEKLQGPEGRASIISGIAHLGVSPPPTSDGEPLTTELRIGAHAFQFMDAISIAEKLHLGDATELNYSDGSSKPTHASNWKPPVFVVDCTDPAPEAKQVSNMDVAASSEGPRPRTWLELVRKSAADHNSFYTTPATHLSYALTWAALGLVSGGLGLQRLLDITRVPRYVSSAAAMLGLESQSRSQVEDEETSCNEQ